MCLEQIDMKLLLQQTQAIRHIDLRTKISLFSENIEHQTCQHAATKRGALRRQKEFRMVIVSAWKLCVHNQIFSQRINSLQIILDILVR